MSDSPPRRSLRGRTQTQEAAGGLGGPWQEGREWDESPAQEDEHVLGWRGRHSQGMFRRSSCTPAVLCHAFLRKKNIFKRKFIYNK